MQFLFNFIKILLNSTYYYPENMQPHTESIRFGISLNLDIGFRRGYSVSKKLV